MSATTDAYIDRHNTVTEFIDTYTVSYIVFHLMKYNNEEFMNALSEIGFNHH